MSALDSETIDIPCENCGRKIKKSIGWIKSNKNLSCSCGTVILLDSHQFVREVVSVEKSIANFKADLKKMFK